VRWVALRQTCIGIRRVDTSCRNLGCISIRSSMNSSPNPERTDRISNVVRCLDSPRTATALIENETSAPVIQSTTRPM